MGIHKITSQVIDYAERVADMADAAQGKRHASGGKSRWLLLPASGAAIYALLKSDSFSRQAKGVIDDAKTRVSELPEDLMGRVRESVDGSSTQSGGQRRSQNSTARKTSSSSGKSTARKTTARKKNTTASR